MLGSWAFRGLDLLVDPRVLIPRPETEWVVEIALEEAARVGLRRGGRARARRARPTAVVADLGTGSGAIALALAAELPDVLVWATDVSADALAVARGERRRLRTRRGCGSARARGSRRCPTSFAGELALVVANPPYVAEHEVASLAAEVAGHEPRAALVSGPTGLEAIEELVAEAPRWLAPGAALVVEIAPHQAEPAAALARRGRLRRRRRAATTSPAAPACSSPRGCDAAVASSAWLTSSMSTRCWRGSASGRRR